MLHVTKSVTINRTPEAVYRFWRDFSNLPQFMIHVRSIAATGDRSHWVVAAPAGQTVEWDAEIVEEIPGRSIHWRTVAEADVRHGGQVEFHPATGNRGTVAKIHLSYEAPAGKAGAAIAKLFGEEPEIQVREDLRRFKRLLETGELPTTEGQPSGRDEEARPEPEAESTREVRP